MINMKHKNLAIIYDGGCGFCQSSVDVIRKLDWFKNFEFVTFLESNTFKKYKHLTQEKCEKEMYLVSGSPESEKNYFGGYDAFKIISVYLPITFLISWFFFLPGIVQLGRIIYRLIARNRHKIKLVGKTCNIDKN